MKIVSWNVNSVRARILNIIDYLKKSNPDILMMQEIKTEEKGFPFDEFKKAGYDSFVFGQKSYNGVAFISKINIKKINKNFMKDPKGQSRVISCDVPYKSASIKLVNIYVPNGNPIDTDKYDYKKKWLINFINEIKILLKTNKNIIIGGDFNIIPDEIDVYEHSKYIDDALFKLEIRKKFRELVNLGFVDMFRFINKTKQEFTFWDYMYGSWQKNYGLRIDHFVVSTNLIKKIHDININKKPRSKIKPSDHTPIELDIN